MSIDILRHPTALSNPTKKRGTVILLDDERHKRFALDKCKRAAADIAIYFLKRLRPAPWQLLAIKPDPGQAPEVVMAQNAREVRRFVSRYNGRRNLYYSVNPLRRAMRKKAAADDIAAVEYLQADLDPRADESSADAVQRYLRRLQKFDLQPTAINESGNGLNVLFKLDPPITDRKRFDECEERTLALILALGGPPGTQDVCRILRLPGTKNLPSAKKRREGRVECRSRMVEFRPERSYRLEDFPVPKAEAKPTKSKSTDGASSKSVPSDLMTIIRNGVDEGERSDQFYRVVAGLKKQNWSIDGITKLLEGHPNGIAAKYEPRLRKEIKRVYDKAPEPSGETRTLTTRSIAEFKDIELKWLWYPFVPLAMVTVWYGESDIGKTTAMRDIIARITTGNLLPKFGDEDEQRAPKGSVLWLNKEEDVSRIVKPRLETAGADISKVHVMGYEVPNDADDFDQILQLDNMVEEVEREIIRLGDARLMFIDPMPEFTGKVDINQDNTVRAFMSPYVRLAAKYDFAIVYVVHLNKKLDLNPRQRAMHGGALVNVPRSAVLFAPSMEQPGQTYMMQEKGNLIPQQKKHSVLFHLENVRGLPRVKWENELQDVDVNEIFNQKALTKKQRATKQVAQWLEKGPLLEEEIHVLADAADISWSTVRRAKKDAGVESRKRKGSRQYEWYVPKPEETRLVPGG